MWVPRVGSPSWSSLYARNAAFRPPLSEQNVTENWICTCEGKHKIGSKWSPAIFSPRVCCPLTCSPSTEKLPYLAMKRQLVLIVYGQSIFLTHPWSTRSSSYKHQGFHFATSLPSQKRGECWIGHTEGMRKQKYWRWVGFRIRNYHVALGIVLTPLVVKSMGEFVTHHHSHRAWRFS